MAPNKHKIKMFVKKCQILVNRMNLYFRKCTNLFKQYVIYLKKGEKKMAIS